MNKPWWLALLAVVPLSVQAQVQQVMHFSTGTGFFISAEGYLLTNNHVIEQCSKYSVYGQQATMQAKLVAKDAENDLALLKTSFAVADIATLHSPSSPLKPGDKLVIVGFPGRAWETRKPVVRQARILELAGPTGEQNWLQFSDSVAQGNSGGPLLDTAGNVIGVIRAKTTITEVNLQTHQTQSVRHADVAINLPTVMAFLNQYNVPYYTQEGEATLLSENAVADKARSFIVNIRCQVN